MNPKIAGLTWFLLTCSALASCAPETKQRVAPTQVLLSLALDAELRAQADALRMSLWIERSSGYQARRSLTLATSGLSWPVQVPILPRTADDEDARFEVIIEALASGRVLAQTRVLTRFLPDQHGVVYASLALCADREPGFVCAEANCHGDTCEICGNDGSCAPVTPVTPDPLRAGPDADDGGSQAEVDANMPDAGSSNDAASGPGADAAPGADATGPAQDASAPNACATENVCPIPYPCVPTALGYTCRGQFADWPMPDSAQGAKHPQSYSSDGVTVVDQVSKLEWQIGIPEVLAGCTQFSRPTSGGVGPVGEFCTLEEARRYCDMLVHGGDSDWRLPSTIELASLLDTARDASRFGINSDYFGVPNWSGFVTNSLYPNAPAYYRVVDFVGRTTWQGEYGMVRCVRAGSEPPFATPRDRYQVDAASDTVEDRATGLIWQRTVAETMYTSEQIDAAVPCPADFRLPGPNELLTLVDPTKQQPAIDSDAFPNTPGGSFWASRPSPRNQGVSFEFGDLEEGVSSAYVRCVR